MSAAFEHRLNSMYKHTSSVEVRAPEPERTPIQKLRQKQSDQKDAMKKRHIKEFEKLSDQHNEAHNADQAYRNGMGLHPYTSQREEAEHEALRDRNKQQRAVLVKSHGLELERAFKEHGMTP